MLRSTIGRLWKIGRIGMVPPAPEPGRAGLAVALVVRNEAAHVREWAEFHAAAGVRAFLVYDDRCTDATIPVLRETLGDRLVVTPWRQRLSDAGLEREIHNQALAYAHAASNFGGAFRWMAFIDVDEFLVPRQALDLDAALAHLGEEVANVSLPWHMFGHSGHATPPEGGVLRSYLRRAADPMTDLRGVRAFKCLVDPCRLVGVGVHTMETGGGLTWNDRGERFRQRDREARGFYSTDHVQLNHYYARSKSELEAKIGRGPNLASKAPEYRRKVLRTVANIEKDEVEDRAALDYLARSGQI
ncbi:glycosyltransferase family 92 protein [Amaricoccus sp.]|uniref:glycosyltransferase family 92 protein n=1 Tax=Amaricoccus sp. TaxID=1872485 RepID=UPI001B430EF6|nr:glycosyltransferase family 92 protein [Amaricoccus sp.]MBP7241459.1 glycosyltransferase family 92 protein [Amaricoccus sp.]